MTRPNPDQLGRAASAGGLRDRLQDAVRTPAGSQPQHPDPRQNHADPRHGQGARQAGQYPGPHGAPQNGHPGSAPAGQSGGAYTPSRPAGQPQGHKSQGPQFQGQQPHRQKPASQAERSNPARPRRGKLRTLAWTFAAVLALAGMGALAWFGFQHLGTTGALFTGSEAYRASPFLSQGTTHDEIDKDLQTRALWQILKIDHPTWYEKAIRTIQSQRGAKQTETAIAAAVAKEIVELRRANAQSALSASADHLVKVARSFTINLKSLGTTDSKTCYDFISYGESGTSVLGLLGNPKVAEPLHRQLAAIFLAIRDGRKSAKAYGTAIREDYDALGKTLTNSRGWKPADLQIFSNPQLLSKAAPEKVCSMVQDWFSAQIELKDEALRSRLLFESLRPLVAG